MQIFQAPYSELRNVISYVLRVGDCKNRESTLSTVINECNDFSREFVEVLVLDGHRFTNNIPTFGPRGDSVGWAHEQDGGAWECVGVSTW